MLKQFAVEASKFCKLNSFKKRTKRHVFFYYEYELNSIFKCRWPISI